MISIAGSVHRSFVFPADRPAAFEFYSNLGQALDFLAHISVLRSYDGLQFRMLYNTTELGIYRIQIFCDIEAEEDREAWALRIRPLVGIRPVKSKAGLHSSITQGYYASESLFSAEDGQTRIDYNLHMRARLPVPRGVRFMPRSLLNNIAQGITLWRIEEIADGFIERSIKSFVQSNH